MILVSATIFGALLGAYRARARGGSRLDIAQYAATHAILFAVIGLFATILVNRMG